MGAELKAASDPVRITKPDVASDAWIARFSLQVPETGDSEIRSLTIIPRSAEASSKF
jgi:hypothetical protein